MITDTSKLKSALESLRPIFKSRNTLPVLFCVKMHTEGNRLHISATNLDEYAVEKIEVDGEFKPICVSFNHLSLALSGKTTEITMVKTHMLVKCGDDETIISTMDADEFGRIPTFENHQTHGAACADLSKAIGKVSWAASDDPMRYALRSTLISSEAKKLSAVSTNGRELAVCENAIIGSDFQITVPVEFVDNFSRVLLRAGAILSSNERMVRVEHDSGFYFCKQIDGLYPNYKHVIPVETKLLGIVAVEEFKSVVAGCCGFSSESEAKGVFKFSKRKLVIEFVGDRGSTLSRHLPGSFAEFTINLSTKKMFRIFQHLKTDEAKIFYVNDIQPIVIEAGDLKVITSPMRSR